MSPTSRRRRRGLIGTIIADPYRKLAAIALAIGLWYFLDSRVSETRSIDAYLLADGLVTGSVQSAHSIEVLLGNNKYVGERFSAAGDFDGRVKVILKGTKAEVAEALGQPLHLKVQLDGKNWQEDRRSIDIRARDLQPHSKLSGLEVALEPDVIRLDVARVESKPLPISIDRVRLKVDDPDLEGRLQLDKAKFEPQIATLVGSASKIATFLQSLGSDARPFKAEVTSSHDERMVSTAINLEAPAELGLDLDPHPTMTIPVNPIFETYDVEMPLMIDYGALPLELHGQYGPEDTRRFWKVPIKISGTLRNYIGNQIAHDETAEAQRNEWTRENLRLGVWLDPVDALDTNGKPKSDFTVQATLWLHGPYAEKVGLNDYSLVGSIAVKIRKKE
ncbi:MAG: hypothetical protein KDC98_25155 [Planctomycetes bacterium]|nr:hypothetical protein [Planctomycetota bacterium]